jgi:hypothetical protein
MERQTRRGFWAIRNRSGASRQRFSRRTKRGKDCRSRVTQTSSHECSRARTLSAMVPLISMTNQPSGRSAACAWDQALDHLHARGPSENRWLGLLPRQFLGLAPAIEPEPVATSTMRTDLAGASLPPIRVSSSTVSTTSSVSGRGIRTAGVTIKSMPQNSWWPVMYCAGIPRERSPSARS